jgi:hypothetical protein
MVVGDRSQHIADWFPKMWRYGVCPYCTHIPFSEACSSHARLLAPTAMPAWLSPSVQLQYERLPSKHLVRTFAAVMGVRCWRGSSLVGDCLPCVFPSYIWLARIHCSSGLTPHPTFRTVKQQPLLKMANSGNCPFEEPLHALALPNGHHSLTLECILTVSSSHLH